MGKCRPRLRSAFAMADLVISPEFPHSIDYMFDMPIPRSAQIAIKVHPTMREIWSLAPPTPDIVHPKRPKLDWPQDKSENVPAQGPGSDASAGAHPGADAGAGPKAGP